MLSVTQLSLGPIGTNCYVVAASESAESAVVVDPSGDAQAVLDALGDATCEAILVTHGHFDHILGVAELVERTGSRVYMPADEREALERPEPTPFGITVPRAGVDVLLVGGERLELAGLDIDVLPVPGHSRAHLAYAVEGVVLSGDVLFAGSVGRTDIPGSDWPTLLASIRLLVEQLPPETVVYPGHGGPTTLARELEANPFLGPLRASGPGA